MFKQTPQQQQWFKDSIYIKYSRKGHFIKDCKGGQQNHIVNGTNILKDDDQVKVIKKYLIKHFAFYYNSACRVHKDTKYGIGQWL